MDSRKLGSNYRVAPDSSGFVQLQASRSKSGSHLE